MRKTVLFLLAAICAVGLVSCTKSDNRPSQQISFVTVHQRAIVGDYYFETDTRKTIYPSDKSHVAGYEATEGQRALIAFGLLDKPIDRYDFNAILYRIIDIYTSEARIIGNQEELDELPDAPLFQVDNLQFGGNWLTLGAIYTFADNKKHNFHLIVNEVEPQSTDSEYLDVELRHDKGNDAENAYYQNYISFNIYAIKPLLEGKKGINLRFKDDSGQDAYLKIDRDFE